MVKKFIVLAALCFLLCASTSIELRRAQKKANRLLDFATADPISTNTGNHSIPFLSNGYEGFTFYVQFCNASTAANASLNYYCQFSYSMSLALYTSDTVLGDDCTAIDTYYCSDFSDCPEENATQVSGTYPNLAVTGTNISAFISLNSSDWTLNNSAIFATCDYNTYFYYELDSYGLIGMGINGSAANNFGAAPFFGVFLNETTSNGSLVFSPDVSKLHQVAQFNADNNWNIQSVTKVQVGSATAITAGTTAAPGSLIFDINAQYMGLPLAIYNEILTNLQAQTKIFESCTSATSTYGYCYTKSLGLTTIKYSELPDIVITIGTKTLKIPPQLWVQDSYNNTSNDIVDYLIYLNFQPVDTTLTGNQYLTAAYANTIILDYHAMTYWTAVFDGRDTQPTITLYSTSAQGDSSSSSSSGSGAIVGIIIGVIVAIILGLGVYVFLRRRAAAKANEENSTSRTVNFQMGTTARA